MRTRTIILSLLAVFAFSAVAAGAAQAAPEWHVKGAAIAAGGKVPFKFTSGESKLWVTAGLKLVIVCEKDKGKGELESAGKDIVTEAVFEGKCKLFKAELNAAKTKWVVGAEIKECEVVEPISVVVAPPLESQLAFGPAGELVNVFKPAAANAGLFVNIVIKNKGTEKCPGALTGTFPVTGSVIGKFNAAQVNKEEKTGEQIFTVTNVVGGVTQNPTEWLTEAQVAKKEKGTVDTLAFGGNPAALESTETVELVSKEEFGAFS